MKKTFLICPVRGVDKIESEGIVKILEKNGYEVHWPHRDTNQNDKTGYNICLENLNAIKQCDNVHIIWDGVSQGCLFDLGMCFALNKEIITIKIPPKTNDKSFQNMMIRWENGEESESICNNIEFPL